ncbi:MAG: NAD-glutamate dehydrogenase, partial [Nevskia sp.]|nr:NAD-glutamate dehydrogenase [Nevskia sp.]
SDLPPQGSDEARPGLAVVETCVADQPFLVDSIMMAVRGAGASVDWTVHPVLQLQRDVAGKIIAARAAIAAPGAAQGEPNESPHESLIHLEFEPLADLAAYTRLEQQIATVLADLRQVVDDYPRTLQRVRALVEELKLVPPGGDAEEFAEAREFLSYLDQHHFTFLGVIESRAVPGEGGKTSFRSDPASGLGLLRAGSRWAAEDLIAPQAELDKYSDSPRLVVVTKANLRSTIHREGLMDVVSVKRYDAQGHLAGTVRFVGLFSADVYFDRPRHIPLIRRKAEYVLQRSRLPETSHSGKNLRDILHGLPRDELFQAGEEQLFQLCMGIRALRDRHQLRSFMRRDRYGRFYSFLVYLPRERYSRELRDKVGATLLEVCGGTALDREIDFLRGGLARVHYVVRTKPGTTIALSSAEVEHRLITATRSWRDQLRELLVKDKLSPAKYVDAFPLSYAESVTPQEAAADVAYLARLSPSNPVLPRLGVASPEGALPHAVSLKLYAHHTPVPLSDVLPTLENFGLRVIRQEPAEITPRDGVSLWVQEFEIQHAGCDLSPDSQRRFFETGFLQVWRGEVENDGLNKLVLGAGLDARQVTLLRAICKYLIQTGLPFSQAYMEALLAEHADIARLLVALFETRFALKIAPEARRNEDMKFGQALDHALDQVASLDGDRVLRAFLAMIRATLRTNYFQADAHGHAKPYVSFKL